MFVFVRVLTVAGFYKAVGRAQGGRELNEGKCLVQLLDDVDALCHECN